MYGVRHDVAGEFPEFKGILFHLRDSDPEFARLLREYDETDKRIYGLEITGQPMADHHFWALKRKRMVLKDRLYSRLRKYA